MGSAEQERSRALDVSRSGRSRTEQQDKQDDTTVEDDARRAERQRLQFQLGQAGTPRPERTEQLTTSKKRRVAPVIDLPPLPSAPAPQTCVATAPVIFTASCVAAVQMKVAQWKKGMNGKAAKMPEELQREVAAVMMGTQL